jgi:UDP-GlcNAc:undecaprenyl-phosphate GlcNAc-1-phosphate transferase
VIAQLPFLVFAITLLPAWLRTTPWLSGAAGIVFLVVMANSVNVLDVADGLASGVGVVVLATIAVLLSKRHEPQLAVVAITFAGALGGFFVLNAAPAQFILGDAGSLPLGGLIALLLPHCLPPEPARGLLIAALVGFVPLFEVIWVSLRRIVRGIAPWRASPHHFVYWLVERGTPGHQATVWIIACQGAAAAVAARLAGAEAAQAPVAALVGGLLATSWLKRNGRTPWISRASR